MASILSNPIEYLKGVGPLRAELLQKELGIHTFQDLLEHFPYRHVDRTKINLIREIDASTEFIQVVGRIVSVDLVGDKRSRRLVAGLRDSSGVLELVWFQGIHGVQKLVQVGGEFLVYGRVSFFQGSPQLTHPEIEVLHGQHVTPPDFLEPVYPTTEKLKVRGLGGRQLGKLTQTLFNMLKEKDLPENLPASALTWPDPETGRPMGFLSRYEAYRQAHFPTQPMLFRQAVDRLKFEELFMAQLRLGLIKSKRHRSSHGVVFGQVGEFFNRFYTHYLPFELTGAQKRVLKEIRRDTGSGRQMNRLLQGDVGSGKTMVALLSMLLALDNGFQACLMAPTEILARQHYEGIAALLKDMPVEVRLLTGSSRSKSRKEVLGMASEGRLHILIGTHAVLEEAVQFQRLGLAIVDEQHRFGVAQRARLWNKAAVPPHVLVMTATPIPRTLAMTAYGDLDYSVMDELPPGRQPISTVHRYEDRRPQVMDFIRHEIGKGRQVYVIFPLIEESEKVDYENLMKGYENVKAWFPEPKYWISMVHGRQSNEERDTNMQRFLKGDTQIMVATTVIEVGVNVPNATVMVIESAEKFGLSQLHQLRGRVGRGTEKSFCILLTSPRLGKEARERMSILTETNNGFKIAEKDLEIRGPGDIEGTRQSGLLNFKLANIVQDKYWLELARDRVMELLDKDPDLAMEENRALKAFLQSQHGKTAWSKIS
ncbi:ATP-dependent DNA helicase RecG [Puia dinghuensis]|uniref:ATP-dependent DNA helicase RecG n=1 Tax=Puia dinghuensis TaxID=1792502 RepID=A0A8J2XVG8_9BACT|nr:ATP-dependent DNA helicase RecG [Puia dinghuensis]GGB16471.1 ATP-dependent DNA helicase RecG [Puia dinghuensis]